MGVDALDRTYRERRMWERTGNSVHPGKKSQGKRFGFVDNHLLSGSAPDYVVGRRVRRVLRVGDVSPNVDVDSERSETTRGHVG